MPNKAWGYARVSTDEQLKSTLGIRGYIDSIVRYAAAHDLDLGPPKKVVVDGIVFDARERIVIESISANKVPFFKRPMGKYLGKVLDSGDYLLVPKVDRAFRDFSDAHKTTKLMIDAGIRLTFLDMGGMDIDLSQGMGAVILSIFAMSAEWESSKISERVKQAHVAGWAAGRPPIHTPPVGFMWKGTGNSKRLVVDPRQMEILRLIERWVSEGLGMYKITYKLREHGITGKEMRPHGLKWVATEELKDTTIRKFIVAAKEMGSILRDKNLRPEDGELWLAEKIKRMDEKKAARKARLDERRKAAGRKRLRKMLEDDTKPDEDRDAA